MGEDHKMADTDRDGDIPWRRRFWRGHSKSLGMDEPWRTPMIFKILAFVVVGFSSATVGFWYLDTQAPATVLRVEVLTDPLQPGADLKIKYTVHRFRSCETTIDRLLFDSQQQRVILEDLTFNGAPGPLGESTYVASVPIPRSFATGIGTYRVVARYVCNPLQRLFPIVVMNADIRFMVEGPALPNTMAPIETLPRR
jgi:hypothetical protein